MICGDEDRNREEAKGREIYNFVKCMVLVCFITLSKSYDQVNRNSYPKPILIDFNCKLDGNRNNNKRKEKEKKKKSQKTFGCLNLWINVHFHGLDNSIIITSLKLSTKRKLNKWIYAFLYISHNTLGVVFFLFFHSHADQTRCWNQNARTIQQTFSFFRFIWVLSAFLLFLISI